MGRGSVKRARDAGRKFAGIGLGLRWDFLEEVLEGPDADVAFFEVSPENYMRRGGYFPEALERVRERYQLVTHGLTMSIGAIDPPPTAYLTELRAETQRVGSPWHSDHLCLSTAGDVVLHDLLPLRLTEEVADRAARRLIEVEERLGLPMAVENISYYALPGRPLMTEAEFITRVIEQADCGLLLDVNNVYVNAVNHGYDPRRFIESLPLDRVIQLHIAGHKCLGDDHPARGMLLDTHGARVIDPVKELLAFTIERTGPVPVLLERDNDIPELDVLLDEVRELRRIYESALAHSEATRATPPGVGNATPAKQPGGGAPAQTPATRPLEEAFWREVTLGPSPSGLPVPLERALGAGKLPPDDQRHVRSSDPARLFVYRRLIRNNLREAILLAVPRVAARLGELFDETFDAFCEAGASRSHYLRDVTGEFLRFAEPLWAADPRFPGYMIELARLEAVEIEIAAQPRSPKLNPSAPRTESDATAAQADALALDKGVRFTEACRLMAFAHAVHRLPEDEADRSTPLAAKTHLLVYRSPEHEVRYLELSAVAHSVLRRLLDGATLREGLVRGCEEEKQTLDDTVLAGTAEVLADLAQRGVLLGARS